MNSNPIESVDLPTENTNQLPSQQPPKVKKFACDASKIKRIKKKLKEMIIDSSSHGIPHIFRTKRKLFKIMWTIFFIICISFGIKIIVTNLLSYLEYDVITNIELVYEQPIQFPTISFQFNFGNSKANYSLEDNVFKLVYNQQLKKNIASEFEQLTDKRGKVFYKFNSGKNKTGNSIQMKNQTIVGNAGSMRAEIFIGKPDEFTANENEENDSFFSIYVHNSSINAVESTDAPIKLAPGFSTNLKITRVVTDRLGEPYNNCVDDLESLRSSDSPLVQHILTKTTSSYRQKDCFNLCLGQYIKDKCDLKLNLGFEWEMVYQIKETNISKELRNCANQEYANFNKMNTNQYCSPFCPEECDSYEYQIEYMTSKFPTESYAKMLMNDSKIKSKYHKNHNITLDDLRESLVSFSVYYTSFHYTKISQLPKMEMTNAVSEFGGILGLFVGVSFLSFGELVEILGETILILIEKNKIGNNK